MDCAQYQYSQLKLMEVDGIAPKIGNFRQCQKLILAFGYHVLELVNKSQTRI